MLEKEDLLEVVINLMNKYTGFDSDSVTLERAEQLMEAVAYCIREYEAEGKSSAEGRTTAAAQNFSAEGRTAAAAQNFSAEGRTAAAAQNFSAESDSAVPAVFPLQKAHSLPASENISAEAVLAAVPGRTAQDARFCSGESVSAAEAYERGYRLVVEKTRAANRLYNEIMEQFCDYGSRAYRDTMTEEMPFFSFATMLASRRRRIFCCWIIRCCSRSSSFTESTGSANTCAASAGNRSFCAASRKPVCGRSAGIMLRITRSCLSA